jgi:hypothetical protein
MKTQALAQIPETKHAGGPVVRLSDVVKVYKEGDVEVSAIKYREGNQNKFGANLTRGLGQKVIAYAEWAGGEGTNLIDESLRYGRETGTLPANGPTAIPDNANVHLQNDLSVGASYTTTNKITFNLEYHLHQAGFSRQDWNNWFNIGRGQASTSLITKELWYIRAYALDQQVPLARQSTLWSSRYAQARAERSVDGHGLFQKTKEK